MHAGRDAADEVGETAGAAAIVSSLTAFTGNATTAERLAGHFRAFGYRTTLWDAEECTAAVADLAAAAAGGAARTVVVGIHAFRTGKTLAAVTLPPRCAYICVLGGTDINENVHEGGSTEKPDIIWAALRRATAIVAFTPEMAARCRDFLAARSSDDVERGALMAKVWQVPQGISPLPPLSDPAWAALPSLRASAHLPKDAFVVLHPAGVRAVKDPGWLLPAMARWQAADSGVYYVLVGPILAHDVFATLAPYMQPVDAASASRIVYHPPVPSRTLAKWMLECDVVVNTSVSEGQSCAIMEAMALGCVVIARNNEGNCALIDHGRTGFLVAHPDEAIDIARSIRDEGLDTTRVRAAAAAECEAKYGLVAERTQWKKVIDSLP